jgi:hypothetical protein
MTLLCTATTETETEGSCQPLKPSGNKNNDEVNDQFYLCAFLYPLKYSRAGHEGAKRNAYRILVGKSEETTR